MTATIPHPAGPVAPVCVACVGNRTNPDGGPCLHCKGTGTGPDPLAPTGVPWPGTGSPAPARPRTSATACPTALADAALSRWPAVAFIGCAEMARPRLRTGA
jgi:hypothetical protein